MDTSRFNASKYVVPRTPRQAYGLPPSRPDGKMYWRYGSVYGDTGFTFRLKFYVPFGTAEATKRNVGIVFL